MYLRWGAMDEAFLDNFLAESLHPFVCLIRASSQQQQLLGGLCIKVHLTRAYEFLVLVVVVFVHFHMATCKQRAMRIKARINTL